MTMMKLIAMSLFLMTGAHETQKIVKMHVNNGSEMVFHLDSDGTHETFNIGIDGESIDFDSLKLAVGESETLTLNGKEVVITRKEEGLVLNIDGEELNLFHAEEGDGHVWIDTNGEFEVEVDHDVLQFDGKTAFLSGAGELSEEVLQQLNQVLRDAGIDKEIRVLDSSTDNQNVFIIKAETDGLHKNLSKVKTHSYSYSTSSDDEDDQQKKVIILKK